MNEQHPYRAIIPPVPEGEAQPLWSVMIPTYNCANYLRETLASILSQDPGSEIMQIEVVDDHSTKDDPAAVVEEIGHGRISFYRQPKNVGFIKNFETCLQRSRGKLIHLLHGDDCVLNGFYCKLQKAFEQHSEIGAAFCRHIYMDEDSHWQRISGLEQPESGILSDWLEKIAAGQRLTTPSIVVRRTVYEQLGGFDRRISCCGEDWEMWVRIATRYPVWYEAEPLAVYRLKAANNLASTSVRTGGYIRDMRIAAEIIDTYLSTYLPHKIAKQLISKARETYAHWALGTYYLPGTARQMLADGDMAAASALLIEALKTSHSFGIIKAVGLLFLWFGAQWIRGKTRRIISLCLNPGNIMELYVRPLVLKASIRHIYGLKEINYAIDELIVLCVVRNGELYIKSFIEHYLTLGVKHIVFLDNNSTDGTIEIARKYHKVTILQTKCP
ncbi:MAG: glycosyltransferase, partial [Scytonema sp. PMC 1069.18]|nr:glycosyltransferase [Scytonema sp. PMC 1069.18]